MKLLIITQKVDINDDVLGFMHGWIEEFAKNCEKVVVMCLQKGEHRLPKNVRVLSLGKEGRNFRFSIADFRLISKLKYIWRFYNFIWRERRSYDKVLVHMNAEYVVLGGIFWRLWRKKVGLWYAHGYVPLSLRLAKYFAHVIFTSTKSGCRIKSNKVKVIGQGIDVNKFRMMNDEARLPRRAVRGRGMKNNEFKIVTVGRISPVKDYETLIRAAGILARENVKVKIGIIGGAGLPEQEKYFEDLKKTVQDKNLEKIINFVGSVPNKDILDHFQSADLFVNMGQTGSLDKAIAEAMACELVILTCNEALKEVLGGYQEALMYPREDYRKLAEKIKLVKKISQEEREKIGRDLREIIKKNHSLERFVKKILGNEKFY